MSLGLSFNDDTFRVQLAIADRVDGTLLVERSINELFWTTVRGGVALEVAGGGAVLSDWEYAEGLENFYRVSPVDPPPGLLLDGTAGGYASTPDTGVLDITGDIDLRADIHPDEWANGANQTLIAKYDTGSDQRSYQMFLTDLGQLALGWSTEGASFTSQGATLPSLPARQAVRVTLDVDNGASGHVVRFYTAPTIDGPFVLFDSITLSGTTSIFAGTAGLTVGAQGNTGAANLFAGTILAAEVRAPIGGSAVADPDFAAQPHGTTGFTDAAGRVWTVQGDALVNGTETDSITPSNGGRVILKSIRHPFLNRPLDLIDPQETIERAARAGVHEVKGRSVPVATVDVRASPTFELVARVAPGTATRDMDLTLASGHVFFVHIPAGSIVPGGYVLIGDTGQQRLYRASSQAPVMFRLPCRVVDKPGPDVTGGTMTFGALLNLYGSFEALLAANPTFADLLLLMASPDDLVVV